MVSSLLSGKERTTVKLGKQNVNVNEELTKYVAMPSEGGLYLNENFSKLDASE